MAEPKNNDIGRMLPHNDDAEKAILGALLLDPEAFDQISGKIKASDFYQRGHSIIFEAISYLREGTLDYITLVDYLSKNGDLEKAGGVGYIAELTNQDTIVNHISNYAEIIKENSRRRLMYQLATKLTQDAFDKSAEIKDCLDNGAAELTNLYLEMDESGIDYSLSNIVEQAFDRIVAKMNGELDDKLETGFSVLDKYCNGGLSPEDYVIVAARPSIGKTAFAISMMLNMINNGKKVAFFSLEMPGAKIATRMLSMDSKVPASKINTARFIDDEYQRVMNSADRLFSKGNQMFIVDVANISLTDLRGKARLIHKEHKLDCIVIDYIGLISLSTGRSDMPNHEKVSQISKGLKSLARELKIPLVVLCQVSRDSEERAPILSNLRDSGSIEQDADVVCFLHRKRNLTEEEKQKNAKDSDGRASLQVTKLIVAKNRDGETGEFKIGFHDQLTSYVDIDQSHEFVEPTAPESKRK